MLSITCNTAASGAQQLLTLAVPVQETGELAIVRLENISFQVASLLQYMSPTVPQQHRIALSPQAPQVACHLMPNKRRPRNQNASQAQNTRYPLTQQILSPFSIRNASRCVPKPFFPSGNALYPPYLAIRFPTAILTELRYFSASMVSAFFSIHVAPRGFNHLPASFHRLEYTSNPRFRPSTLSCQAGSCRTLSPCEISSNAA